jgi:hypothetical protein
MPCTMAGLEDGCSVLTEHWHCISCGYVLHTPFQLCAHHGQAMPEDWAVANRIYCDFIHRGKIPARLPESERAESLDVWG